MRILFLCDKKYWNTKLARERFHAVENMSTHIEVDMFFDGPGYDNWKDCQSSFAIYRPDIIWWYKPLLLSGYNSIPKNFPKIITYNETYLLEDTRKEIFESKSNIVVLHHENVMSDFSDLGYKGIKVVNIPHCINPDVFKDYHLPKDVDILFAGVNSPSIYPLRGRWMQILKSKSLSPYKIKVLQHPGYEIPDVNEQIVRFAQEVNKAKVVVSCSSIYKYALTKYLEVPICNSLLIADLPNERHEFFSQFIEPVTLDMSDEQLIAIVKYCVNNVDLRTEKCKIGMELISKYRTYNNYSEQLLQAIKDFNK